MKILLVGGFGRSEKHYVQAARELGHDLTFHENGALQTRTMQRASPDVVLVVLSLCGHALRLLAQRMARMARARYVVVPGHSISQVRAALEGLTPTPHASPGRP